MFWWHFLHSGLTPLVLQTCNIIINQWYMNIMYMSDVSFLENQPSLQKFRSLSASRLCHVCSSTSGINNCAILFIVATPVLKATIKLTEKNCIEIMYDIIIAHVISADAQTNKQTNRYGNSNLRTNWLCMLPHSICINQVLQYLSVPVKINLDTCVPKLLVFIRLLDINRVAS